jgi:hypothetical protein
MSFKPVHVPVDAMNSTALDETVRSQINQLQSTRPGRQTAVDLFRSQLRPDTSNLHPSLRGVLFCGAGARTDRAGALDRGDDLAVGEDLLVGGRGVVELGWIPSVSEKLPPK